MSELLELGSAICRCVALIVTMRSAAHPPSPCFGRGEQGGGYRNLVTDVVYCKTSTRPTELAPDSDPLRFEVASAQKRAGADEGAGGKILAEVSAINLVELFVEGEIRTKDFHGD